MQLKKVHKKLIRHGSSGVKVIKLEHFNPVVRPGFEITHASFLHNMQGATHVVIHTQRKSA